MAGTREQRIEEIGRDLLQRALAAQPSPLRRQWWIQRLLAWSMADPIRRVQFFRFVDVLPSLRSSREITQRLHDVFLTDRSPLPTPAQWALKLAPSGSLRGWIAAEVARQSVRLLSRVFIAGETDAQAETMAMRLRHHKMSFSLDILGEANTSESQADEYAARYRHLLEMLGESALRWPAQPQVDHSSLGAMPPVNVSVKLSALDPQFDPISPERAYETVAQRLRPILRTGMKCGAHVHLDMEDYAHKALTLYIARRIFMEEEFRAYPHFGLVLQAYLRESHQDLQQLLTWARERGVPLTIRLVKGAYWDTEVALAIQRNWPIPVFTRKSESDANFERMAEVLLANRALLRPAFASHNVRSIAAAIATAEELGATPQEYEFQMLYGMADPLKVALVERGYLVRVYAPYGPLIPGMGYLIRRLLENTSNNSFLRQSFLEHIAVEQLLADPAQKIDEPEALPPVIMQDPLEDEMEQTFANEPLTDFGVESNRQAMMQALQAVKSASGKTYSPRLNGAAIETPTTIPSINPSHKDQTLGLVGIATNEMAEQAVATARAGWEQWRRVSVKERARLIRQVASAMRRRRFELNAWIVTEAGKPWREADGDVAEAIDFCEFYSALFEHMHEQPRRRDYPGEKNCLVYEPRGVAVIIAPWNFPLAILTGMTVAALVAGNTVIVKPAEQTSIIASLLFNIFEETGIPSYAAHFLPGYGEEIGAYLVAHSDVDLIAFTGSKAVGMQIIQTAAEHPSRSGPKKVIAEMGGKNAILVDTDADLDEAVKGILASAYGYAGQKCSACSRLIVLSGVKEALLQRLGEAVRSLPVGPVDDPANIVGPLIDDEALAKVQTYIHHGKDEAHVVCEAGNPSQDGWFVSPIAFDQVLPDSTLIRDEIFGPVLVILKADSMEEAIAMANATDYALTAGIYSRDPSSIELAKTELLAGNLYINREITGAKVDRQPFGGFKMSGVGSKAGGPDYLLQFCVPKAITENVIRHGLTQDAI